MSKNTPSWTTVLGSLFRPTTKEYDRKLPTIVKRTLGQVVLFLFVLPGLLIMYLEPLSSLTCRYVETKQVDCRLREYMVWVISVRDIPITRLQRAYVDRRTETRRDEDDDAYTVLVYRIILVQPSGEIEFKNFDTNGAGADRIAGQINNFLETPTDEMLTVWGDNLFDHTMVTLGGGVFVVIFGFLFVATFVGSVLLGGTWLVDFGLLVGGWAARKGGFSQDVADRIAGWRRAVRGVAVENMPGPTRMAKQDQPWRPCTEGQIKGKRDSMIYHKPDGRFYARIVEDVDCYDTEAEAEAAGFRASRR